MVGVERRWRTADGLSLYARDYAAAAGDALLPVVCLHGLTRNSRDFEFIAPHMAERGRRVLALDMRGRGQSDRDPAEQYDIAAYVDDVLGLMDALGIARAVFVGTSMRYPERVAAAVINDIGPQLSQVGLGRIAGYVGQGAPLPDWQAAADACARMNADVFAHYGAAQWMAMARRLFREQDGQVVLDYDPAIASALARIVADPDPWVAQIHHAGAIFIGHYTSEALGDYCAGPNHVLPTSGSARFSSPLGVYDFQKRTSLIKVSRAGAQTLGRIASTLAQGEGLPAHAKSAEFRLEN